MKSNLFAGAVLLVATISATAAAPSGFLTPFNCGKTTDPNVLATRFLMPAHYGMDQVYIVNVTFVGPKPTEVAATQALKQCLAAVMAKDMSQNILVTSWYRKSRKSDPDLDLLFEPFPEHQALTYDKTKRQVLLSRPGLDHETRPIN